MEIEIEIEMETADDGQWTRTRNSVRNWKKGSETGVDELSTGPFLFGGWRPQAKNMNSRMCLAYYAV